jgi:hypothetical protein
MPYRFWPFLIPIALLAHACGSSAPSAPSSLAEPLSSTRSVQGATVSAIDGGTIPHITVTIGNRTATSDATGAFQLDIAGEGSQLAVLAGPSVIERRMMIALPSAAPLRASLIPAAFDLVAFDQMFRGTDHLQRWTTAPSLVVLKTVLNYEIGFGDLDEYHATSEQITEAETALLIEQLTEALATLTGSAFTSFASVERESAASGVRVKIQRAGRIVVARYKGLQALGNTIGKGRWATDGRGQVTGGTVYLDRDFDTSSDKRRLLRTHELGHALGYLHVTNRPSIMNPAIGPDVTTFDREGAAIAFQRNPGNHSPDVDPASGTATSRGGIFEIAPGPLRTLWAEPLDLQLTRD